MRMLTNFIATISYIIIPVIIIFTTLIILFYLNRKQQTKTKIEDDSSSFIPYTGYLKTNGPDINYVGDDWTLNRKNHREIAKIAEQSGRSANYLVERMIKQYRSKTYL